MRPRYRIGLIVAICVVVMFLTSVLLNLLNPNVANFASGPYSPLLAAITGGSANASDGFFVGSAGEDGEQSSLTSSLFDDPTSAAIAALPSATPFVAAEAAPLANSLLVEPTIIQAVSKPGVTSTSASGGAGTSATSDAGATSVSGGSIGGGGVAPTEAAVAPDERDNSSGSSPNRPGSGSPSTGPNPTSTSAPIVVPSRTPISTPVPSKTTAPLPTNTSGPIVITEPTNTPLPTDTPVPPTNTPVPPTDTPALPTSIPTDVPTKTPKPKPNPTDTPVPPTDPPPTDPPPTDPPPTDPPPTDPPPVPDSTPIGGSLLCPPVCITP